MLRYIIMPKKPGSKRGTTFIKKVKEVVREELQEELEEKTAVIGVQSMTLGSSSIPHGNVSLSSNFIRLFPFISQGNAQYNARVGNEIRLKSVDIKMLLNFKEGDDDASNYHDSSLGVRVMILRQKDNNDAAGFVGDSQTNKLLENGSISTAGPSSFTGTTLNLLQKINRDQFSVRYDKVFYMDRSRKFNTSNLAFNRPPRPTFMSHRLTFGKNGLKLTYGDGASDSPTNFPYVMVIGYASTIDQNAPLNSILEYSYTANASYTDA